MSKNNGTLPMPEVDFTRVGRKWTKRFGALIHEAERSNRVLMNLKPESSSISDIEAYEAMYDRYLNKLNEIGEQQISVISDVLVSVPQECLTQDAPNTEDLDWTAVESYDWMRQDVMVAFFQGLQNGELARKSAKN